ncbi:MAG TPA: hypothetical protein VFS19_02790 [Planctomycetota bacterium]|nr:hypothetical protein [Planctomycetota bacterium]
MNVQKISWSLWVGGVIVVLLSWTDVVSRTVGWVGFGVACLGVLLGQLARRK